MRLIVIVQGFIAVLVAQPLFSPSQTKGQITTVPCKLPATCIDLQKCQPYMDLLKSTKQEVHHEQRHKQVLKFMRARMCAFDLNEPKVCCEKSIPNFLLDKNSTLDDDNNNNNNKVVVIECPDDESYKCVDLLQCESLVYLWGVNKTLAESVAKKRQCGSVGDYPKVCCRSAWRFVVDRRTTTTSTEMSLFEKSRKLNVLFEETGIYDDLAFNLLRRRRNNRKNDELDIEIR